MRNNCTSCGTRILKSAFSDPYLCRNCERFIEEGELAERYNYLDSMV